MPPVTISKMQVGVFCASRFGNSPVYAESAEALARALYKRSWGLVYGGGTMGLMGSVAKTLYDLGGDVHGVRVKALIQLEVDGRQFGRSTEVESMHERKAIMAAESDAFVALPGGFGTLEELLEIITWSQIGLHGKPIVVFNVDGFFDNFLRMVDGFLESGFVDAETKGIVIEAKTAEEVIEAIEGYVVPCGREAVDWSGLTKDAKNGVDVLRITV